MKRVAWGLALALLAACGQDAPQTAPTASGVTQQAVVAEEPLPEAVEAAAPLQNVMIAAIEGVEAVIEVEPLPPPPPPMAACRRAAATLITQFEVTSPGYYKKRLERPVWPKGASGVTWGIGYDGGHQTTRTIVEDWTAHDHKMRLAETAGVKGKKAQAALPKYRDIRTPYLYAAEVFETRSLIEYERIAERTYRVDLEAVPTGVCAALVSLAYNRGGATAGDARKEVRNIRDKRLPAFDWSGVAADIRSMKRLWTGTVNQNGLYARREAEAILAETLR